MVEGIDLPIAADVEEEGDNFIAVEGKEEVAIWGWGSLGTHAVSIKKASAANLIYLKGIFLFLI